MDRTNRIKLAAVGVAVLAAVVASVEFLAMRNYRETVILGPSVSEVRKLSQYEPSLSGTPNDVNIYIMDSGKPGGTVMVLGGTHPEEPVGPIAAHILVENARLEAGRLVVVTRANRSASLYSRNGEAYPNFFRVKTDWGEKKWRLGDRGGSPLDSWPDPEVYVHWPSHQMLAYMDIRNLNRTWPGRADGLLTERTTFGLMNFIRQEKVDMLIDLHEAELEYPVENTIVAHEKAQEIAAMASMMLTAQEFAVPIGMEFSPKALHGLSHREVGDYSEAMSILFEVAEPMLDRIRGVTDESLLMEGKDDFVVEAGKHGLLYAPMDEKGWPIEVRVGRHLSTILQCIDIFSMMTPDRSVTVSGVPRYAEVIEKGPGAFLKDPAQAEKIAQD
ncbi:MAG: succinylglutamate desuccinylase [Synergistaceae bacterium]|jgi:predicted deacylase|nr:succinylglutamate desuccinylase [Synergistaceae bacterium]